MILLLISTLLIICVASSRVLKEETLHEIRKKANWESYDIHENPFRNYTEEKLKSLFGVKLQWNHSNIHLYVDMDDHSTSQELPKEFDSRKQWPDCPQAIRNQEHCGSCWAFSGTEVLQDRFCIASKGQIKVVLSPQDMVSCDSGDHGCQGGMLNKNWEYFESTGVVTDECFPYTSGDGLNVPHCPHGACVDSKTKYVKYRALQGSSKPLTCPLQIKKELLANGPVQTGFIVYEDFMHYRSGIYEHNHGSQLGGHAVKIIGWGEEEGKEYWIVQNSWGEQWGENGYFRIKMGECFMDQNAYVGLPNLHDFTPRSFLFWN